MRARLLLLLLVFFTAGLLPLTAGAQAKAAGPGERFRDCPDCPEMIVIPPGRAMIGSDPEERRRENVLKIFADREGPRHPVTFAKPFAMSTTEITVKLFNEFARETHLPEMGCATYDPKTDTWPMQPQYSWHSPGFAQTDTHPVGCANWRDANAFAAWLAKKTGRHYRLPSEAEWEYGARAGTDTARYWGDDSASICERANIMSRGTLEKLGWPKSWDDKLVCSNARSFTQPVASYPANAFGLYDMLGNVWEWVADCYHPNYEGAPADGSAWSEPDCQQRIPRGGGLHSEPWLARAATRGMSASDYRGIAAGIRVARDLDPPPPAASPTVAATAANTGPGAAKLRRGYVDMRYGQLHYQIATPSVPASAQKRPLIMFHQSPLSSMELAAIAAEMGADRVTIAVDTPGQGFSDGPAEVPTIADYAAAIDEALHRLGFDTTHPVDVLGNHTGAFIATELAIQEPSMVRRIVMAGVYVVPEERRLKAIAGLSHPANSVEFYDQLCRIMPVVEKYYADQNLDDGAWGKFLASSLLPVTHREYGHEAAFAYSATVTTRLAQIQQPVLLLAMNDGIGGPTKDSAKFFKHAELKDFPDYMDGAFTTHARELAEVLRAYLN